MFSTFLTALEQMSRLLILISIGFVFNKLHLLPKAAESVISRLVTTLLLPCLMLYTNIVECRVSSLVANAPLFVIGTVIICVYVLLSYPLGKLFGGKDTYRQGVFRYAFSFPNTGAVATPLVLAFYGTAGLFQFNLFWFAGLILTYTWGVAQMTPTKERPTFWGMLRKCINPTIVAIIAGMILGLLNAKDWIPPIVLSTTQELGNCYVIMGLLLTGYSVADYPLGEIFGDIKIYLYSAVRLLAIPVATIAVLFLCNASRELCIMAALALASPCGMNTVIFPAAYGKECKTGASMVLISSLLSILTIPVIYAIVLQLVS